MTPTLKGWKEMVYTNKVENVYFKATSGLISGIDLTPLDGKSVIFIDCEFHANCDVLLERNKDNWGFYRCSGSAKIPGKND